MSPIGPQLFTRESRRFGNGTATKARSWAGINRSYTDLSIGGSAGHELNKTGPAFAVGRCKILTAEALTPICLDAEMNMQPATGNRNDRRRGWNEFRRAGPLLPF